MRIAILFLFMLVFAGASQSQRIINFSGHVADSRQNPIAAASIYLLNSNRGAISDEQGNFSLNNVVAGKYIVQVSAIGYATIDLDIELGTATSSPVQIHLPDAAVQLDAVMVSAQKTEEFLQQVPLSISAISGRQVQQYRLWNSHELTAIVPNLYSSNSGDNRNVTSIRGITTTSYDPAIATYIDGVNQFGLDTYIAQLLDIERIEILRGPQGTLYGRNAMGGVINIITRQPTNVLNEFAEVNIGNHGQQRYVAGIRGPLIKDKFFLGVSGMYEARKGYYTNQLNNTSFDRQHSVMVDYDLRYIPNSTWSFRLNVKHNNHRNNGPFPLVNGVEEAFENPFLLNQNATAKMIDNTFNASFTASASGKALNFSSQTAYQLNHRYYNQPLDGDFSPIDGVTIINNYPGKWNKVKALTQEFRFTSPASTVSSLKWTAGTYIFFQDNPNKQATHFGKDAALLGLTETDFSVINTTKGKSSGFAFYGQATYSINDQLDLIAGMRYDYENKKYNVLGQYQKDPDPNPVFDIRPDTTGRAHFSAVSPRLGLSWKPSPLNHIYINYSRGYRTGGLTQLSSDPSQLPLYPFKPEYSNNLEVGTKNSFLQQRLRVNFAIFLIHVNDAQVPTLILPDAITITRNAGKLTSKGVELELATTPVKGLQVDYNFGLTDAEYKNLKLSQNGASVDLAGKKQIFTPEMTSMLALQYAIDLSAKSAVKLIFRGEWISVGKQYFDLANNIVQKAYSLLNTRFGVSTRHADCMFWARNIGNKKYIAYAYDFGAIHLGDPSTIGLTLSSHF